MSQAEHITSDNYRVQILRKLTGGIFTGPLHNSPDPCIQRTQSVPNKSLTHKIRDLFRLMVRTLAPLRKIVSRSLDVLSWDRIDPEKPASFILQDGLECGHVHPLLGLDIFDLLNAYTDNPGMTAKRHRCLPCLRLASRKPMASVKAAASKAGAA